MARDIGDGYIAVTERTVARLGAAELDQLAFELDRRLRDLRGESPPLDDTLALQQRNRRIQRLAGALQVVRGTRQKRRR